VRNFQAYFWNISTLIPGIPVLAIMVRYNLLNSGVVGPKMAFFFGVVAPWLVTMFCYQASMLVSICNWSALLTIGVVNLVVPIALYREALFRYGDDPEAVAKSWFPTVRSAVGIEAALLPAAAGSGSGPGSGPLAINQQETAGQGGGNRDRGEAEGGGGSAERVQAVPDWLAGSFPGGAVGFAEAMIGTVAFCSLAIIILNIYSTAMGLSVGSDGSPVRTVLGTA
jgi:hypothetical protein